MLFALKAVASVRCPECDVRTPMPGLRSSISCHNCAAPLDIVALASAVRIGGIRYPFGAYYDAPAESFVFGAARVLKDVHNSDGTPMAITREDPKCLACEAALGVPSLGTPFFCTSCGDEIAVRAPDDGTRVWDPRIHCVIGDAFGRGAALPDKRAEGSAIACGNCGAELAADGKKRLVACTHCASKNFIADDAYTKLFPRPTAHPFYILYSVPNVETARRFHQSLANVAASYVFSDAERAFVERYGDRCR